MSEPDDAAGKPPRTFMALPSPSGDSHAIFYHCLAVLTDLLGADIGPEEPGTRAWYYKTLTAIRLGLRARETLPDQFFDALIRVGIYDPNPSRNAQVIKPAVAAFGCLRVQTTLLEYLRNGTNAERAGAARAMYWASAAWRWKQVSGDRGQGWWTHEKPADPDGSLAVLRQAWSEAALREFVANEDIDVRCSILPGLPLITRRWPAELHGLVAEAISIARAHPHEYIRHRVEIQVNV
ncbi:MAG TPA: hypothetical protein VF070_08655 [Streptosporangiaceae bacterium]